MSDNPVFARIEKDLKENDIVLYMKGSKQIPQCGFSATVVQVLARLGIEDFKDVNVLADKEVWQGIKDFSDWPTIPQLFIKGELIGGCDITREMYQNGELQELLKSKGIEIKESN
jgi:monothiol glutaredoxin